MPAQAACKRGLIDLRLSRAADWLPAQSLAVSRLQHLQLRALLVHPPWSHRWDTLANPPSTKVNSQIVKRPLWWSIPPYIKKVSSWLTNHQKSQVSAPHRRGNRAAAAAHGDCWFPKQRQGRDYDKNSSSAEKRCPAVSFEGLVGWVHGFQSAMTVQPRAFQHCCVFSTGWRKRDSQRCTNSTE